MIRGWPTLIAIDVGVPRLGTTARPNLCRNLARSLNVLFCTISLLLRGPPCDRLCVIYAKNHCCTSQHTIREIISKLPHVRLFDCPVTATESRTRSADPIETSPLFTLGREDFIRPPAYTQGARGDKALRARNLPFYN